MASVQELRDALAALAQTTTDQAALTNDAIQRLAAVTLGAVSTGPGAAPSVVSGRKPQPGTTRQGRH